MSYSDDYEYDSDDYYHEHERYYDADPESVKAWSSAYAHFFDSTLRTTKNPTKQNQPPSNAISSEVPTQSATTSNKESEATDNKPDLESTKTHPNLLSVPKNELLKTSVSHSTDILNNKRDPSKCQSNQNYIKNQNFNHPGKEEQTANKDPNANDNTFFGEIKPIAFPSSAALYNQSPPTKNKESEQQEKISDKQEESEQEVGSENQGEIDLQEFSNTKDKESKQQEKFYGKENPVVNIK